MINNFMTVKEVAVFLGYTDRNVTVLCTSGKLLGAFKDGGRWFIPEETVKIYHIIHPKNSKKLVEAKENDSNIVQSCTEVQP